jgi:hypothetical protein
MVICFFTTLHVLVAHFAARIQFLNDRMEKAKIIVSIHNNIMMLYYNIIIYTDGVRRINDHALLKLPITYVGVKDEPNRFFR